MDADRNRQIIRASFISIIGNVVLAVLKAIVGIASSSIAITLDAVNSLADALSSVIAIIGTKLAAKPADRDHPFGYGRIEYISSVVIAVLIISAGVSALVESIQSIMSPHTPDYSIVALIIVGVAAVVKAILGLYLRDIGKKVHSSSLMGSGSDSMMDALVSAATLLAAILYLAFGILVESWLAAGIAVLICKSGLELLVDTLSKILGERMDPGITAKVEREARKVNGVQLASGLVLMDLGPDRVTGSIHVTVDGDMTVAEFDRLARDVQRRVYKKTGVTLSGVTPYAASAGDDVVARVRANVGSIVWQHEHVVEMRGLFIDPDARTIRFDAIVEFGSGDLCELQDDIARACEESLPNWSFEVRALPEVGD